MPKKPLAAAAGGDEEVEWETILSKAKSRALRGGTAGAMGMCLQVGSLMWLRTTMNYQYRSGVGMGTALKTLYKEGKKGGGGSRLSGIGRFYRGIGPALLQAPLSRFGDTAANTGVMAILDSRHDWRTMNPWVKTGFASAAAVSWRVFLMPIDAFKTTMQVEGKKGVSQLISKIRAKGPQVLWHGTGGAVSATWIGYYPWFGMYNWMETVIPTIDEHDEWRNSKTLGRNALKGFCASIFSDCSSNWVRVLKTYVQTYPTPITYREAMREVIAQGGGGTQGVFLYVTRGLKTRIVGNGIQAAMFSVLWKQMEERLKQYMD